MPRGWLTEFVVFSSHDMSIAALDFEIMSSVCSQISTNSHLYLEDSQFDIGALVHFRPTRIPFS